MDMKGLFAGVSVEGSVILERKETNAAFYRRKVTAEEILSGAIPPPPAAEELYRYTYWLNVSLDSDTNENQRIILSSMPLCRALNRRFQVEGYDAPVPSMLPHNSMWPDNRMNDSAATASSAYEQPIASSSYASTSSTSFGIAPAGLSEKAVALYDFPGERDGDLSFVKGDLIHILQRNANDWWLGRCNGKEGVFPANYVQTS
jgi:hypothetical protein